MAYGYYQQSAPGWGTNHMQFGPPPVPNFQPQPSWGGMDYYRAHAVNPDASLFNHAWNRVRDYGSGGSATLGVGTHEARHWHRRAYGGLGELNTMTPNEIGHAAAYEAYRTWIHNSSIYEPLSDDIERQREGLIGLAVAEATRLLQFSNRPMDNYARMEASEAAAATASYIFYQSREGRDDEYRSRSRHRRGSFDSSYAYDDDLSYPRGRSQSRHRSRSRGYGLPQTGFGTPGSVAGSLGPGGYGAQSGYGSYPGAYAGSAMSSGGMSPYTPGFATPGMPIGAPSPYAGGSMPLVPNTSLPYPPFQGQVPMVVPMAGSMGGRSRSNSFSYPQQPYMGSVGSSMPVGMGMQPSIMPPGQTIIIQKPHRKHRHRHHSSRARSSERY